MNKTNMQFHEICAVVKEISVHNRNIHVHQAPFSNTRHQIKSKKKKLTLVTEYMYEVQLFHRFSSRILQNFCPYRQCRSRSDYTDCTV